MNSLVEDPSVGRTRIKQSSDLLGRFVTHVDISNIRKVHMVVMVKTEATTSLLRVLIELTLVHICLLIILLLWFATRLISLRQLALLIILFRFNFISHILREEIIIQILLSSLEDQSYLSLLFRGNSFLQRFLHLLCDL